MSGLDVRKRSSLVALSSKRSGIRMTSDIYCNRWFTMAKASASRPAGLVKGEEWVSQSGLWTLKSPRMIISEQEE